ncbi:EXS family-domain-containing protein [Helicostylum pulchrum]|nr:EXS family-domain-containing protein [Helicostylum pulchrum]
MDVEGTFLPLTYRPIALFSLGIWGWALNLLVLSKSGIDPVSLLQLHQVDKQTPLYKPIFILSAAFSMVIAFNLYVYWYFNSSVVALLPYISCLALLFWPGKAIYRKERIRFIRMSKRVLSLNIFAPVFFSDIILADMLTSFSNVFGDLYIAGCVLFAGQKSSYFMDNTDNLYYRDVMVPLFISLPYLIRLKQCVSEYVETKERRHVLNAIKYTSSLPVVILASVQKKAAIYVAETGSTPNHWYLNENTVTQLWILFVFINSMYSFWWDISMDWNLITVSTKSSKVKFRTQLYFPTTFYIAATAIDFLLRITWSLKLSSPIYIRQIDASIFLLLEIFRRWVWVIFRLENEWVKKIYNTLPLDSLRLNLLDRKTSSGLLSPIEEEDP